MLVPTPEKYQHPNTEYKNDDTRRSYQNIIDMLLDFKEEHPQATEKDLNVYAIGIIKGRTKHKSDRR